VATDAENAGSIPVPLGIKYGRLFQDAVPLPSFNWFVFVSTPTSAKNNTGFDADQLAAMSRRS